MVYSLDPAQAKIAEKLIILNDRAIGMLTRVNYIKKRRNDARLAFLHDKQLESAIKHIARKFPVIDTRNNSSTFSHVNTIKEEIITKLLPDYHTFVDVLDLKDHVMQLLTLMDACQCQLDICLNFELTTAYLNLVSNLISLMWLLSRVEDRKILLGLFNVAHDLSSGQSEPSYPRLGQMILDYDNPFKKLAEDFGPLNRLILAGLTSLSPVYVRRNVTAETWRSYHILSLTATPQQICFAAQTETIDCEYLSLDVMDRWIILCVLCCPTPLLSDPTVSRLWQQAVQMSLCLRIFRDETLHVHATAAAVFEGNKQLQKRAGELKEFLSNAQQESLLVHMERRRYLRGALRELVILIKDQPGLLGPKVLFVWMALSFSRDEVAWLLRHVENWPTSSKKNAVRPEDVVDRQLPELLHHMLELRELVSTHERVIQNYYTQYVTNYDCFVTREVASTLKGLSEEEATVLSDMIQDIETLNSETRLDGIRLDWFRLQARWSMSSSTFSLMSNKKLAVYLNATCFHINMIDGIQNMLKTTSDLSLYCFYPGQLESQWKACLELPVQCRHALSFARIASHFPDAVHQMCPEEEKEIVSRAVTTCHAVLENVAHVTMSVLSTLCEYELRLTEQTAPSRVSERIAHQMANAVRVKSGKQPAAIPAADLVHAGFESQRADRMQLTLPDKLHTNLVELCLAIGGVPGIVVADRLFRPREYLSKAVDEHFPKLIVTAVGSTIPPMSSNGDAAQQQPMATPRRPSQLLLIVQAYMTVFQHLDSFITIDTTRVFNRVLLQQMQPVDAEGRITLTSIYSKWYLEVLMRRASSGQILYTEHMRQMVSASSESDNYAPEQYTDPHELRALAQLLGPDGVKYLSERLAYHAACQIGEIKKRILSNRDQLQRARTQFDKADEMREVYATLCQTPKDNKNGACDADVILHRTVIIGEIFAFRDALQASLRDVLARRLPYLTSSFRSLSASLPKGQIPALSELAAALGEPVTVDMSLAMNVRQQTMGAQGSTTSQEEQYQLTCLFFTAIAVCLPHLAKNPLSCYRPLLRVSMNNAHCLPLAVSTIATALFHMHGQRDLHLRMREFVAIASASILRACREDGVSFGGSSSKGGGGGSGGADEASIMPPILAVLLEQVVQRCPALTADELDACFPHDLVITAYRSAYQQELESRVVTRP